jgi:hypothetical protein
MRKAGPYVGPRGGKWADAKHTIPWKDRPEMQSAPAKGALPRNLPSTAAQRQERKAWEATLKAKQKAAARAHKQAMASPTRELAHRVLTEYGYNDRETGRLLKDWQPPPKWIERAMSKPSNRRAFERMTRKSEAQAVDAAETLAQLRKGR